MTIEQVSEEEPYKLSNKRRIDATINTIIRCLEDHICLRMLYEYNQYRDKREDNSVTSEELLSRFTIMTFADGTHEELRAAKYLAEVRRALESIVPNAVKAGTEYLVLLFVLRTFNDICILCLDGKPFKNGEFLTLEEARRECDTIN